MSNLGNRRLLLASRPVGVPQPSHFRLDQAAVPDPAPGEIVVRNIYLSVDPAQRGWVNAAANYSRPVGIGEVMRAFAAGEVIASQSPDYKPGDLVMGMFGWQEVYAGPADAVWYRADTAVAPLSAWLGPLGLNGITAYIGLLDLGQPKEGETVVVSTAAGAVGSIVGQIAKLKGCRTVGICGSDEKVAFCRTEFEYDEAVNYKTADLDAALARDCPQGVDVYFDNTSGAISDAVLRRLAFGGRVVICGTAAIHNWDPPPPGPRVERQLLVKGARMQGFVVLFYRDRFAAALHDLGRWLREGKLHYREDIVDGLEQAPAALVGLYEGRNRGKMLIRVGDEP